MRGLHARAAGVDAVAARASSAVAGRRDDARQLVASRQGLEGDGVSAVDETRVTLTFEDRRGNVLIADLHEDRVSVLVAAQGREDDALHAGWVHLTGVQARELAQAIFRQWGET